MTDIKDPHITLREGLSIFKNRNSKYFSEQEYKKEGQEFIESHDIAHVVFGCNTTLYGEGIVKIWTTFGSNLSFWEVTKGYKNVNAHELASEYSAKHVVPSLFKLLRDIPLAILRSKKMKKPWPFYSYHPHLDHTLFEIRKEYNIQILE